jgi:hypothetical protein
MTAREAVIFLFPVLSALEPTLGIAISFIFPTWVSLLDREHLLFSKFLSLVSNHQISYTTPSCLP